MSPLIHFTYSFVRRPTVEPIPIHPSTNPSIRPSVHRSIQDDDEDEDEDEDGDDDGLAGSSKEPVPCLIMGEVMPGFECVSPKGSDKWVTLWELNKMRRNEPEKISALW